MSVKECNISTSATVALSFGIRLISETEYHIG